MFASSLMRSSSETRESKRLWQPRLLEHAVGRMARSDGGVDGKASPGDRAEPDFVVALARTANRASGGRKQPLEIAGVIRHGLCGALVGNDLDLAHEPEGNVAGSGKPILGQ